MISTPNQIDPRKLKEEEQKRELKRLRPFGAVPEGYLPDEDDPAWPSRSGQAD